MRHLLSGVALPQMADVNARERGGLEAANEQVLSRERQRLEAELGAVKDDMDRQYMYRREQLRQELTEQHEKVAMTSRDATARRTCCCCGR